MEFEPGSLMTTATWLTLRDIDDRTIGMLGRDNVIVVLDCERHDRLLQVTCLTSNGIIGVIYVWHDSLLSRLNVEDT